MARGGADSRKRPHARHTRRLRPRLSGADRDSELLYLHTAFYAPAAEGGVTPTTRLALLATAGDGSVAREVAIRPLPTQFRGVEYELPPLQHVAGACFLDLGFAPPSNAYLTAQRLTPGSPLSPESLRLRQLLAGADRGLRRAESCSSATTPISRQFASWLAHAARYAKMITERLSSARTASSSRSRRTTATCSGTSSPPAFPAWASSRRRAPPRRPKARHSGPAGILWRTTGATPGREGKQADLIVGNNVYAHVPDINDFTRRPAGRAEAGGTITLEFPHLMRLIEHTQFDTVYHEHFSYLSLTRSAASSQRRGCASATSKNCPPTAAACGSMAAMRDDARATAPAVARVWRKRSDRGLQRLAIYRDFRRGPTGSRTICSPS